MKIIIDEFNGFSIVDVQLQDGNKILYTKQGLTQDIAETVVLMLTETYDLAPATEIVNTVFNDNEEIQSKNIFTLDDFINP